MKSPFKFLDAYTLADRELFFGRDQDIEDLYDLVFKARLLLVYGNSGTGKTSLIQCGLASKFDGPDWYPFWIRKNGNINDSLRNALTKALKDEQFEGSLAALISELFNYYLRPIYLVFDQFEELFILGTKEEQTQFVQDIQTLFDAELPCKIIFVMREEYLGSLYQFERNIPSIFDHRLRIEFMSNARIKEVMRSSFQKFNITLDGIEAERLQEMVDNLSGEKSGVQLPYLQVYLDMLYRDDYERTYGNVEPTTAFPALTFTQAEIADLGKIENVLEKFLFEQEEELQRELKQHFPTAPDQTVRTLLDHFVTEEGTKRPLYYQRVGEEIQVDFRFKEILPDLSNEMIHHGLTSLEDRRLVRFTDHTIELAHDSLAALIDEKRTDEQRQLNAVLRQIKSAYGAFDNTGEFLTKKQLNAYEDFLPKLRLEPEIQQFIERSKTDVLAKERVEQERQQRELALTQQKLAAEQRAAKRQRFFLGVIGFVAIVAIVAGVWAIQQRNLAVQSQEELSARVFRNQITFSQSLKSEGEFQEAIKQLGAARDLTKKELELAETEALIADLQEISMFMNAADSLSQEESSWLAALDNYQKAYQVDSVPLIQERITNLEKNIQQKFEEYKDNANQILQFTGCKYALDVFMKAYQLNPNDEGLKESIKKCGGKITE